MARRIAVSPWRASRCMQQQADRAVGEVLDEVAGPVARRRWPSSSGARRGGRVDHHRAARQQAEGRRQQQPVLERLLSWGFVRRPAIRLSFDARPADACRTRARSQRTSARKWSPRSSKSAYWSKEAQAGESSTVSPGSRRRARGARPRARGRPRRAAAPRPGRAPRAIRRRVLADQVDARHALARPPARAARSRRPCRGRRGSRARRRRSDSSADHAPRRRSWPWSR